MDNQPLAHSFHHPVNSSTGAYPREHIKPSHRLSWLISKGCTIGREAQLKLTTNTPTEPLQILFRRGLLNKVSAIVAPIRREPFY